MFLSRFFCYPLHACIPHLGYASFFIGFICLFFVRKPTGPPVEATEKKARPLAFLSFATFFATGAFLFLRSSSAFLNSDTYGFSLIIAFKFFNGLAFLGNKGATSTGARRTD